MLLVLWATGFVLFIPLLRNRFIADDYTALSIFRHYRTEPFLRTVLYGGNDFFRPLNMALIMARGAVFGDDPVFYVIANILLHLINTSLVYLIARRIFRKFRYAAAAAMMTAVTFLVAFSHYESITWISSSVTLFVTLFFLISVYGHVRYRENGRWGWLAVSIAGMVLALLTKETAVSLPFVLLAFDLIMLRKEERSKGFFWTWVVYGALTAAYLAVQTGWALNFAGGDSVWRAGWHVLTNIADYWVWLWLPNPRHPYVAGVLSVLPRPLLVVYWIFAGAVALTLPAVIVLVIFKKLKRELVFSLAALMLSLLVFLPFAIKISARYAYLPSVFISLFAGGLFAGAWCWLKERGGKAWLWVLGIAGALYLAGNLAATLMVQREFVKVSGMTERLAFEVGELVELEDEDVVFIEGLPSHVHLREAIQWYHNPFVHVHATNDKYRGTPRTLAETRDFYHGSGADLYYLMFEDDDVSLISAEVLSP